MAHSKKTTRASPKTDYKRIADYYNKEKVVTRTKKSADGRKYFEVISVSGQRRRKKRVYALGTNDLQWYTLIETFRGDDFFHCVYLGAKCTKDFWKRVRGYRISTRKSSRYKFSISFYEIK